MTVTAIILTFNEELHLARCLASVAKLTNDIIVVDCFSTDRTLEIAQEHGAKVIQRAWDNNHSNQVNWALSQLPASTQWVIRIDADEILSDELITDIRALLPTIDPKINGVTCIRQICFQGKLIRYGAVGANQVLRLFRYGFGQSEARWMDEHIKVEGPVAHLKSVMIDDNLQPLSWWIEKHNHYSNREAVDLLNLKYQFAAQNSVAALSTKGKSNTAIGTKRWIKENIYARLPGGLRSSAYFLWRYVFMLGFLDGARGTQFHFLQALWYRSLVDAKVAEVERYMKNHRVSPREAIQSVLGIAL